MMFRLIKVMLYLGLLMMIPSIAIGQSSYLKIEKPNGKEKYRLNIGDEIKYILHGEDFYRHEQISDLKGDGQYIITNHNIVQSQDIKQITLTLPKSNIIPTILQSAGGQLLLVGIASLFYERKIPELIPIGAASFGAGALLRKSTKEKKITFTRGMFLKVWENPY